MLGYIGYYKLDQWWSGAFTQAERSHILERFNPLSVGGGDSTKSPLTDLLAHEL